MLLQSEVTARQKGWCYSTDTWHTGTPKGRPSPLQENLCWMKGCTENTKTSSALQLNCKFSQDLVLLIASLHMLAQAEQRCAVWKNPACSGHTQIRLSGRGTPEGRVCSWDISGSAQTKNGKMYTPLLSLCLTLPWMLCTWYN